jgi:hypothetical protein
MTATSKLFVREASMAPIYSILLFGGELRVLHDKRLIVVRTREPAHKGYLCALALPLRVVCCACVVGAGGRVG